MEARKFGVRVRKRYWKSGSIDADARLRIGLEHKAPTANLILDDWIETKFSRTIFTGGKFSPTGNFARSIFLNPTSWISSLSVPPPLITVLGQLAVTNSQIL